MSWFFSNQRGVFLIRYYIYALIYLCYIADKSYLLAFTTVSFKPKFSYIRIGSINKIESEIFQSSQFMQ